MYIYGDVYLNRHQEFAASGKLRFYFALCLWVQNKEGKKKRLIQLQIVVSGKVLCGLNTSKIPINAGPESSLAASYREETADQKNPLSQEGFTDETKR